ncbi:MAG: hypothetical protein KF802_15155 [Bdellovibrionaceae bacterium]|nr:hypothetical protein [Pseudobdellovibrionaceae bacterium]MBX3033424.1 hypothetical protein [Pseudobdellovibrionaceae bacterium]
MSSSKIVTQRKGDRVDVQVIGFVGEQTDLFQIDLRDVKHLELNLAHMNYINSVGVGGWVKWTGRFTPDMRFTLVECPHLVINQINMVVGFIPKWTEILSFYLPYACTDCNAEKSLLMKLGTDYEFASAAAPSKINLPEKVECPNCKAEMEMDVVPSKYLFFLNRSA